MIIIYLFLYIRTKGQKSVFDDISTKKLSLMGMNHSWTKGTQAMPALYTVCAFGYPAGNTSEVTYRLNLFALGFLLDRIRAYKLDSLMINNLRL